MNGEENVNTVTRNRPKHVGVTWIKKTSLPYQPARVCGVPPSQHHEHGGAHSLCPVSWKLSRSLGALSPESSLELPLEMLASPHPLALLQVAMSRLLRGTTTSPFLAAQAWWLRPGF